MKDKKRLLKILLALIIVVAIILAVVLILGAKKEKELKEYYAAIEEATCDFAVKENYTAGICNAFENLCKVKYEKLIAKEYIDGDLVNPVTHKKISEDTSSYVQIVWKDNKISCIHKEG